MDSCAHWIAQKLNPLIAKLGKDRPNDSAVNPWYEPIEMRLLRFIAMIQLRMEEYGFEEGSLSTMLDFSFPMQLKYMSYGTAMAKATIAKGDVLTFEENTEVIRESQNSLVETFGMTDSRS